MGVPGSHDGSLMASHQYVCELRWLRRLVDGEEAELLSYVARGNVERSKDCPDQRVLDLALSARDRLVEVYQPLVLSVARDFVSLLDGKIELLDLVQEGNIGFLDVLSKFVQVEGRFSSWVAGCVRLAIRRFLSKRLGYRHFSASARQLMSQYIKVQSRLFSSLGRDPSVAELAEEMGVSVEVVCEVLMWRYWRRMLSLEVLCTSDDGEDMEGCLGLVGLYQQTCVDRSLSSSRLSQVREAVAALSPRQRQVIQLRYGMDEAGSYTQVQVAEMLGLIPQTVFVHERRAEERLRRELAHVPQG